MRLVTTVAPDITDIKRVLELIPELVAEGLLDDWDCPYFSVVDDSGANSEPNKKTAQDGGWMLFESH